MPDNSVLDAITKAATDGKWHVDIEGELRPSEVAWLRGVGFTVVYEGKSLSKMNTSINW